MSQFSLAICPLTFWFLRYPCILIFQSATMLKVGSYTAKWPPNSHIETHSQKIFFARKALFKQLCSKCKTTNRNVPAIPATAFVILVATAHFLCLDDMLELFGERVIPTMGNWIFCWTFDRECQEILYVSMLKLSVDHRKREQNSVLDYFFARLGKYFAKSCE